MSIEEIRYYDAFSGTGAIRKGFTEANDAIRHLQHCSSENLRIAEKQLSDREHSDYPELRYDATSIKMQTPTTSIDGAEKTIAQTILGKSKPQISPITIFSVLDFLANHSRLPDQGKDLKALVEIFSSRLPELRGIKNPTCYSLKMSRTSSTMRGDLPSELSFGNSGASVITADGRLLILSFTESPSRDPVSSLLGILERGPIPERYFLSERALETLEKKIATHYPHLMQLIIKVRERNATRSSSQISDKDKTSNS